ncbi:MAG: nuclear transport factor 2 family protein [Pseudomonadota bacterium]
MRGYLKITAALLGGLAMPALAQDNESAAREVIAAADTFLEALRSKDQEKLAAIMRPDGTIMIDDRLNGTTPNLLVVPNAAYLQGRDDSDTKINEVMRYESVHVDGNIGQVWGPYRYTVDGKTTHCGINSLTFIRRDDVWKLGNSSFTMVSPDQCEAYRAPPAPTEAGQ